MYKIKLALLHPSDVQVFKNKIYQMIHYCFKNLKPVLFFNLISHILIFRSCVR